jgi:hypothetical protein
MDNAVDQKLNAMKSLQKQYEMKRHVLCLCAKRSDTLRHVYDVHMKREILYLHFLQWCSCQTSC